MYSKRRNPLRSLLLVSASVALVVTVPGLAAAQPLQPEPSGEQRSADTTQEPANTRSERKVKRIQVREPISIESALRIAKSSAADVRELRFGGNGLVGGYFPKESASIQTQARRVKEALRLINFSRRFDRAPLVTSLVVSANETTKEVRRLQTQASSAPAARIDASAVRVELQATFEQKQLDEPQDLPSHMPSQWRANTYSVVYPNGGIGRALDYFFAWNSLNGHSPSDIPVDWGLETGVTIYNDNLGENKRPTCIGPGDANRDFWASTFNGGFVWGGTVPANSRPYPDNVIASDLCNTNSLEIGIGYPRRLQQDTVYLMFVEVVLGNLNSSRMQGAAQLVSNDCNDLGLTPGSDCMDLNTPRDPGVEDIQLYVNEDHGWTVPGCMAMRDGWLHPRYIESGSTDHCKAVVEY